MQRTPRLKFAVLGLVLVAAVAGCSRVPGVYVYEKDSAGSTAAFDPKTYVDGIWAAKVVPTVQAKAVDVTTVEAAIAKDPDAAGKQYGHQAGTGSPYAYLIKGSGTVTKVDTEAATGPVTVKVPGAKPLTLTIATGPVIAGTALRDGVGFIAFGDFTNQIDYANVANELNARVKSDVIAKVDLKGLTGKQVTFAGAFSELTPGQIFLVPTALAVVP